MKCSATYNIVFGMRYDAEFECGLTDGHDGPHVVVMADGAEVLWPGAFTAERQRRQEAEAENALIRRHTRHHDCDLFDGPESVCTCGLNADLQGAPRAAAFLEAVRLCLDTEDSDAHMNALRKLREFVER